jgi:hypothetical protein
MMKKSQILETSDGRKVHILRTNARGKYPIVALYEEPIGYDMVCLLTANGEFWSAGVHVKINDVKIP